MDFLKDYFTWNWRWGRLKFWFLPLISLVLFVLPILATIAYISLEWYSQDAKNSKVYSDLSSISKKISIETTKWKDINDFILPENKINYSNLWEMLSTAKSPYENSEYRLFINKNSFLVYWETVNSQWNYEVRILWNDINREVKLDWIILKNWDIINDREPIWVSGSNVTDLTSTIAVIIWVLGYFMYLYVSYVAYMKRLHDLGQSWWLALLSFLPFVNIWLLIYCWFFPWDKGANKYWDNSYYWPERIRNQEL